MQDQSIDNFSREVVEIMPQLYREFAKREDNELSRGQISFPQMVALVYISKKSCVSMKSIANNLGIKMSSASTLIDRLIRDKMLTRRHDEKDRRIVQISITAKGTEVIHQILHQKERSIAQVFAVLTEEERAQYLRILKKVYVKHAESGK